MTSYHTLLSLLISLSPTFAKLPCDSLVPEYCALPYPNSYFTMDVPLSESPTGVRVNFSQEFFPRNTLDVPMDPKKWNRFDGFSPFPSILAYFPDLSDVGLPPPWDVEQSLKPDSPTILYDVSAGTRLSHFAELDSNDNLPLSRRALMMWPTKRLNDSSRYIVALRGLRTVTGKLVEPSETFKILRDKTPSSDHDLEARRLHFEDIFSILEKNGVERSSLQLAWDFTTASLECLTKRLLFVRDDSIARSGSPLYHIDEVNDNYDKDIFRRLKGTMSVPLYLDSPFPGGQLVIDEDTDLPVYQSLVPVGFTVLIPHSIANGSVSSPLLLQYGHGLFGSQEEVETGYLKSQANTNGYITFACDWWGLAEYDVPAIVAAINLKPSDFNIIPDRLTQAQVNAQSLMRLMKSELHLDPRVTFDGAVKIDPSLSYYYGNSLGGIMGEVYMATTKDVLRGVLGVAGGPFALLLPRSKDFDQFQVDIRVLHPDPVDFSIVVSIWDLIWSRLEPSAYMSSITKNPLKDTPIHRVIYHYAPGDAQVNILGLYSVARSAGAVMFESNIHCNYAFLNGSGLVSDHLAEFKKVPDESVLTTESVAMGFDCGVPPNPRGNYPAARSHDTHERPRRTAAAQKQIDEFIRNGVVRNTCGGACKC